MGRWLAVGTAPGWDELAKFSAELEETTKWRVNQKTTITTVFALGDGRLLAECHAPERADFEDWLQQKGWTVESLAPIKYIAKTGDIWSVE